MEVRQLIASFGVGEVVWSMLWFFIFFMWIMLLFQVTIDIFRSRDLGGVAKALWVLFVISIPYLGVLVYLIARGGKMHENQVADAKAQEAAFREYVQGAAGTTTSVAAELERLASLHERGLIDDAEFAALKAKAMA